MQKSRNDSSYQSALRLIIKQESESVDFSAAAQSIDTEIVTQSSQVAEEEREHAILLQARQAALQSGGNAATAQAPDIDPPHQPE